MLNVVTVSSAQPDHKSSAGDSARDIQILNEENSYPACFHT